MKERRGVAGWAAVAGREEAGASTPVAQPAPNQCVVAHPINGKMPKKVTASKLKAVKKAVRKRVIKWSAQPKR